MQNISYESVVNYTYFSPLKEEDAKNEGPKSLFNFGNIQYNGSFGRELSFGNSQNAVVNSNFQLQINGMLKDSIEIAAALTDNNLPVQPDGTTQQLNEFDQVFLQFRKKNWQLNLGDIDIRQNNMYFLNFYKRLQGVSFQVQNKLSPTLQSSTLVSGSIAKGKFTRNVLQGLEGNQGPYRLTGANNELFFIVLPNTERVYLDGELLQRGEDQDYIINYNTAEVTFMPRRMITKDSRIQIEFEYADRNYLNANLYLNEELTVNKKLKLKVGAFNNSDAKNSPINQTLDVKQKQLLYDIGDSINRAFYPTAVMDTLTGNKILYQKIYVANGQDSFYRYSTDPSLARFALGFSNVGAGNGNYTEDFTGANGKVFKYVATVAGVKTGQYEPVQLLVTPKKQQLLSVGAEYAINGTSTLKTELALSNYDVNTFSGKNGGDDAGLAAKVQFNNVADLAKSSGLQLVSSFDYEHVEQKFKPLERLRYVEFTRDWGLPLVLLPATENIIRASTGVQDKRQSLSYQFMTYQRSDNYKGYQSLVQQRGTYGGWQLNNQFSLTTFSSGYGKGSYLRPVIDIAKALKKLDNLRFGLKYSLERNIINDAVHDTVLPTSFSFDTYTAYIKTDDRKKNRYGLTFFTRSDKYPGAKGLVRGDRSYNYSGDMQLLRSARHQLVLNATYRILKVYDTAVSHQQNDKTVLGRAEYLVNEWHGALTANVLYELGTGQEQRRDFTYLEVPAGQGQYTWNDYNGDGIQQLNEFEVAIYRDQAKFIRIFVPSAQYIKANFTTLNYNFTFSPKLLFGKGKLSKSQQLLSRFILQSSLQKSKKSLARGDFEANPFKYGLTDTALLTLNTALLNNLSYNRSSADWGFDISHIQNSGKALLTYGYESRLTRDLILKLRWSLTERLSLDVISRKGKTSLGTSAIDNRNYNLNIYSTEPRISYIRGTVFRLQGSYRLETKKNTIEGYEKAASNAVTLETKYNVLQNSAVSARITYNNINYLSKDGKLNTAVSYVMLDGLLPGGNYLWSVDFTKRLFSSVELNFQYEGRKPGNARTVHVGRAALRALF